MVRRLKIGGLTGGLPKVQYEYEPDCIVISSDEEEESKLVIDEDKETSHVPNSGVDWEARCMSLQQQHRQLTDQLREQLVCAGCWAEIRTARVLSCPKVSVAWQVTQWDIRIQGLV